MDRLITLRVQSHYEEADYFKLLQEYQCSFDGP